MSYSMCLNCERMVEGYEKYCDDCIEKFGLPRDDNWHKNHWFDDWDKERKEEVEKDIKEAK